MPRALPYIVLAVIALWPLLRTATAAPSPAVTRHEFDTMRTRARLVVLAAPGMETAAEPAIAAATAAVRQIESLMNPYREGSDLWRLNRAEPGVWVPVHPLTWRVVMEALRFHRLSGGAFGPTVSPLKRLYFPEGRPRGELPPAGEVAAARQSVGAQHLLYEREGMRLAWSRPGMSLDLSALAKGFAVDRAMEALLARGIRDGLVEIGGEIRVAGTVPEGGLARPTTENGGAAAADNGAPPRRAWRMRVMDPRDRDQPPAARLVLARTDAAVATSGDYEQYFEIDGRRYSHIVDPRDGSLAPRAAAATVCLPGDCMQADALATLLCVLGPDDGRRFMESRADDLFADGAEAWVYVARPDGEVQRTDIEIPGPGLERIRGGAPAPAVPLDNLADDIAAEARWLEQITPR